MIDRNQHLRGLLLTTLGVLILTPDGLLIRLIGTDVWTLIFWRGLLGFLAISTAYVMLYGRATVGKFRAIGWAGVAIALLYTGSNILFIQSIRLTFVANTLIIIAAAPLLAAVFSWVFLREQVAIRTWLATLFGLGGIAIIFAGSTRHASMLGEFCALGAGVCMAATFVVIRFSRDVIMIPALALSGLLLALCTFPMALPLSLTTHDTLLLVLLGGFVAPLSFALITLGPRTLTAPEVGLILLLETVLGPVWVWLMLDEAPPSGTLLGGFVVLATLGLHSLFALRESD